MKKKIKNNEQVQNEDLLILYGDIKKELALARQEIKAGKIHTLKEVKRALSL